MPEKTKEKTITAEKENIAETQEQEAKKETITEKKKEEKIVPEKKGETKERTEKTAGKKEEKEKTEKKKAKKEKTVPVVQKPKEKKKPKAVNKIKKTKEQKKLQEKIKQKRVPSIRGHFGKSWLRRKKMEKWNKWRKPRGIDYLIKKENGAKPTMGYRTPKEIRGLHPSGMKEVYVRNLNELKEVKEKDVVVRIKGTIGKKTRKEMRKKAKEMNLRILN